MLGIHSSRHFNTLYIARSMLKRTSASHGFANIVCVISHALYTPRRVLQWNLAKYITDPSFNERIWERPDSSPCKQLCNWYFPSKGIDRDCCAMTSTVEKGHILVGCAIITTDTCSISVLLSYILRQAKVAQECPF